MFSFEFCEIFLECFYSTPQGAYSDKVNHITETKAKFVKYLGISLHRRSDIYWLSGFSWKILQTKLISGNFEKR